MGLMEGTYSPVQPGHAYTYQDGKFLDNGAVMIKPPEPSPESAQAWEAWARAEKGPDFEWGDFGPLSPGASSR